MRCWFAILLLTAVQLASAQPVSVHPVAALEEMRYCGPPKRDAQGIIVRRSDVLAAFQKIHPCPNTGKTTGACDWQKDHVIPLADGGCDSVSNLQYLPPAIKNGPGLLPKDRWERRIYADPMQITQVPK